MRSNDEAAFTIKMAGYEDLMKIRKMAVDNAVTRLSSARSITENEIREVRKQDLEGLEKLLKRENARIYKACDTHGKMAGFIIVLLAFEHTVTGEFQADINEIYVLPEKRRQGIGSLLLAKAEKFIHSKGLNYSSLELLSDNKAAISFFQKHGYVEEIKILVMKPFIPREPENIPFNVRPATTFDFPKIRELAVESAIYSKPSQRDIDDEMLKELFHLRMFDPIEARQKRDSFFLIAEADSGEFAGFILAERERDHFCNTPQLKVVNIAVHEAYWGKKAAQALYNSFLRIAVDEQVPYITGVIASENRRSWLFFSRIWKAVEERKIIARKFSAVQR